jgi:serine/threonine-protein kinase RsbT
MNMQLETPSTDRGGRAEALRTDKRNGTTKAGPGRVTISSSIDVLKARRHGRALATKLGFAADETALIATAISEVARNIVEYALPGEIIFTPIFRGKRQGLKILARDDGPGISNVTQATQLDCPSRKRLGVGLPGTRWLVDDFDIVSQVGKGTTVTMTQWVG